MITTKTVVKKGGGGGSIWRKRGQWKSKISIASTVFIGKLELLAWIDVTVGRMIRLALQKICIGMMMGLVWIIEFIGVT